MTKDLVEAARRGDRAAFEVLVRERVGRVYRTAVAILGSPADAEDAVQEAFVAAWRSLRGLREAERFDAWLGRIVLNACRMALRRRGRVREIPAADLTSVLGASPATGGDDPTTTSVEALAFDRAFERLSVDDRALLVLRHRDDLGIDEIAARLGVPPGTVKSRLHRARAVLERFLEREEPQ